VFVPEGFLRLEGVGGNAQDRGSGGREIVPEPGEVHRLLGAAGGVGAGVKEDHELPSQIVTERNVLAAIAGQAELRRGPAFGRSLVAGFAAVVIGVASGFCAGVMGDDFSEVFGAVFCAFFGGVFAATVTGFLAAVFTLFVTAFLTVFLEAFLAAFAAAVRPAVLTGFGAVFLGFARVTLPDVAPGDFLRVFLDIRLPFVAFGGSIFRVLWGLPEPIRRCGLALCKSADLGVWLQGIRRNPS
jgi:hypothetical protein